MNNIFGNIWRKINNLFIQKNIDHYIAGNKIDGESKIFTVSSSSTFNMCSITVNGGPVWFCGKPSCKRCNVMTEEKAQKINNRFLLERGYIK